MKPTIIETDQMLLVGCGFYGDPFSLSPGWTEENEIGRLWNRYMAYLTQHGQHIKHVFLHRSSLEDLSLTLDYAYHTWLHKSGVTIDYNLVLEHHGTDMRSRDQVSEIGVHIPIATAQPG